MLTNLDSFLRCVYTLFRHGPSILTRNLQTKTNWSTYTCSYTSVTKIRQIISPPHLVNIIQGVSRRVSILDVYLGIDFLKLIQKKTFKICLSIAIFQYGNISNGKAVNSDMLIYGGQWLINYLINKFLLFLFCLIVFHTEDNFFAKLPYLPEFE